MNVIDKEMNKFRKQLERVGMTKEFENWMKTPLKKEFRKGSRVQVVRVRDGDEAYYAIGDKGTVVKQHRNWIDSDLSVKFDPDSRYPNTWFVRPIDIKLL